MKVVFGIKDEIFTTLHKDIFISYKILRLIEVGKTKAALFRNSFCKTIVCN